MDNNGWFIHLGYKPGYITRQVYIFRKTFDGKLETIDGNISEIGSELKPNLEVLPEILQALVDKLTDNGFKPQSGFLEGKLEATEKHLEDMRDIVFKNYPVKISGIPDKKNN